MLWFRRAVGDDDDDGDSRTHALTGRTDALDDASPNTGDDALETVKRVTEATV